jgi:hypothetical protein
LLLFLFLCVVFHVYLVLFLIHKARTVACHVAPCKANGTLHERVKIIESVTKNPTEKWLDIAKRRRLSHHPHKTPILPRTREILGQNDKRGKFCKKWVAERQYNFRELESVLLIFPGSRSFDDRVAGGSSCETDNMTMKQCWVLRRGMQLARY